MEAEGCTQAHVEFVPFSMRCRALEVALPFAKGGEWSCLDCMSGVEKHLAVKVSRLLCCS